MTPQQFARARRRPIVGTSLTVGAPTGQSNPQRYINIGTNRWSFKPEVALSYPVGERWLVDVYAGLWLFGTNGSFYPGTAVRTQTPTGSLQTHISYSLSLKAWAAFDATWYRGGQGSVDDVPTGGRESNSRVGATLVFPVGNRHAIKVGFSTARSSGLGPTSPPSRWDGRRVGSLGGRRRIGRRATGAHHPNATLVRARRLRRSPPNVSQWSSLRRLATLMPIFQFWFNA